DVWPCTGKRPHDVGLGLHQLAVLVVKEVQGSGGYGMLIGPAAKKSEIEAFRSRIKANPANYIAQPTLSLSTCPTFVEQGLAPRHVDLRPYVLSGRDVKLVPGGLTRVALTEGSLVVNSSQGGGTKDTWLEVRAIPRQRVTGAGATEFFDWVKERSHLFRGVTYGTIVRGEAFNFSRLGTFLERADNTARILDVKYHILLPSVEDVGG